MKGNTWVRTVMTCVFLGFFFMCWVSEADASSNINRLGGADRYETAVQISKAGWPGSSEVAILATGENYPDALASAPLAKKFNAPILLTQKNTIPATVTDELIRLGVKTVYISGGTGVVSGVVENNLKSMNIRVIRLAGANRYETSVKIAEVVGTGSGEVFIANGHEFAEALSASPIAAMKGVPIILTDTNTLPAAVVSFLSTGNISTSYVLGGTNLIGNAVVGKLPGVERISGSDKYERNVNIVKRFENELDFSQTCLATGDKFPDALAGSVYASMSGSPIILVDNVNPRNVSYDYVQTKIADVQSMNVFGLEGAVPQQSVDVITGAVSPDPSSSSSPSVGEDFYDDNNRSNINYQGFVAQQDGWMYYHNKMNLYKAKLDGSDEAPLLSDSSWPTSINVKGDWIYYLHQRKEIRKVRTDGTQVSVILSNAQTGYFMIKVGVAGNHIYFVDAYTLTLYRINLDGTGLIEVAQDVTQYYVQDGKVYYITSWPTFAKKPVINSVNTDGTGKKALLQLNISSPIDISGDWIYFIDAPDSYSNERTMYRAKLDGSSRTKVADTSRINCINVYDGWIYYQATVGMPPTGGSISRMRIDGTGNAVIYQGNPPYDINVVDGWIYFSWQNDGGGMSVYRIRINGSGLESMSPW